jgi:hypothetical protein
VTDAELIEAAAEFRAGILGRRSSEGMCAVVCWPLQGYLSALHGITADVTKGEIDIEGAAWCNHLWLKLPDGRVLDPTLDQFNGPLGRKFPAVYLGEPVAKVHR